MTSSNFLGRAAIKFLLVVGLSLVPAHFGFGPAQSQTPQSPARRGGQQIPPPQYIPPHDYDQRNIKLDLRFDWEQEKAIGTATITFAPMVKDLRRVDFDAAYMSISAAALASGTPLKFENDVTKEKVSVLLDRPYQPSEELTVVISYHTNQPPPERRAGLGGGGINFIKPRPGDPTRPILVGFAAETGSLDRAADKLVRKGVDLLVANDVAEEGSGFGTDTNHVWILSADGDQVDLPIRSKRAVADEIFDRVAVALDARDAAAQTGPMRQARRA